MRPSKDSWECRFDCILEVLSNIESSYASIRGSLRVQIVFFYKSDIESSYVSIRRRPGLHHLCVFSSSSFVATLSPLGN